MTSTSIALWDKQYTSHLPTSNHSNESIVSLTLNTIEIALRLNLGENASTALIDHILLSPFRAPVYTFPSKWTHSDITPSEILSKIHRYKESFQELDFIENNVQKLDEVITTFNEYISETKEAVTCILRDNKKLNIILLYKNCKSNDYILYESRSRLEYELNSPHFLVFKNSKLLSEYLENIFCAGEYMAEFIQYKSNNAIGKGIDYYLLCKDLKMIGIDVPFQNENKSEQKKDENWLFNKLKDSEFKDMDEDSEFKFMDKDSEFKDMDADSEFNDSEFKEQLKNVDRITWYQLQKWIEFEWFDKLYQHNDIKQRYLNHIKQAKTNYKCYTDKILIEYFNCPSKTTQNKTKEAFITNRTGEDAFIDYNYPFYFPNGLYHFVLFSRHDIIHTMGSKQMKRLISNYIEDKEYTDDILAENDKYEFLYYGERTNLTFFRSDKWRSHDVPLLSEIIDINIIPNIIHVFINIIDVYKVTLGANGATWANESFLWTESCNIINNKEMEKFGREEKKLRKYIADRNKKKTKKKSNIINANEKEKEIGFNSIRDKILIKEFLCKSEINGENNKLKAIVDDTTPRLLWTENLYPYFYEAGIQHNIVWYLDSKLEKNVLDEFVKKHIGEGREYIYWENPPHLKSIPDLNHYQVISVDMNEYMTDIKYLNLVHKPYEWDVFANNKNISEKHKCDTEYGWDERVCRRYLQDIEETKMRFNSLIHADLRKYFKCKVTKDKFDKLMIDENNEMKNYDHDKYVFVSERYHFNLGTELKQYLLIVWDPVKWDDDTIQQTIKFELEVGKQNQNVYESQFVFWETSQRDKETQSLNLWYYHVIQNQKN